MIIEVRLMNGLRCVIDMTTVASIYEYRRMPIGPATGQDTLASFKLFSGQVVDTTLPYEEAAHAFCLSRGSKGVLRYEQRQEGEEEQEVVS